MWLALKVLFFSAPPPPRGAAQPQRLLQVCGTSSKLCLEAGYILAVPYYNNNNRLFQTAVKSWEEMLVGIGKISEVEIVEFGEDTSVKTVGEVLSPPPRCSSSRNAEGVRPPWAAKPL